MFKNDRLGKFRAASAMMLMAWSSYPVANSQVIFDGQTGEPLLNSLRSAYTPSSVETFEVGEDLIYDLIYRENDGTSDGVYCVYTGFFVPFDGSPSLDPSQDVTNYPFQDSLGLSIEHTWPQSKGAGAGNAQVNMHHLFPAKKDVNWARASLPFGDITDAETSVWYRDDLSSVTVPNQHVDEYSELLEGQLFEPREDHKGNVARAMFYFYTIYRSEADAADPAFFNLQKNTFRDWHFSDPPDQDEVSRGNTIASYQSGMINPFVQDITLVDRAYFEPELPVEMNAFQIQLDEPNIRVSWQTESERNNAFFTISLARRSQVTDEVTIVASGHFDAARQFYGHTFREDQSGLVEVILTQTDITGTTVELARRSLQLNGSGEAHVYPNPGNGMFLMVVPDMNRPAEPSVKVFDVNGRLMQINGFVVNPGSGSGLEIRIDASVLARGVYFVNVKTGKFVSTKSFVVNR